MVKPHIIIFLFLIISSCTKEKEISYNFFDPELTIRPLDVIDLEAVKVDVPLFQTYREDTLIQFHLTADSSEIMSQRWGVEFVNTDSLSFEKFLMENNTIVRGYFNFSDKGVKYFPLRNFKRNITFVGSLTRESKDTFLFSAWYHFPFE